MFSSVGSNACSMEMVSSVFSRLLAHGVRTYGMHPNGWSGRWVWTRGICGSEWEQG